MADAFTQPIIDAKIPVGRVVAMGFEWLQDTFITAFDALELTLRSMIGGLETALIEPHPFIVIAAFGAVTWLLQRKWVSVLVVVLCAVFALNQGHWDLTMQTLTLVLASCVVCMGVGVPLGGIYAAHHPKFYRALRLFWT